MYQKKLKELARENHILKQKKEKILNQLKLMEIRINTMGKKNLEQNIIKTGTRITPGSEIDIQLRMTNFIKSNIHIEGALRPRIR